jgi:hypothetical protein
MENQYSKLRYLQAFITKPGMSHGKQARRQKEKAKKTLACILATVTTGNDDAPDAIYAHVQRWYGTMREKFTNINDLVNFIIAHPALPVDAEFFPRIKALRDEIDELMKKSESNLGTLVDKALRNARIHEAVDLCRHRGQAWAHEMHALGNMTAEEVHAIGFLLLGEGAGRHERNPPTKEIALIKATPYNEDYVSIVVDKSDDKNAGPVKHALPDGVRYILIRVLSGDGNTELVRKMSTRVHNDLHMPEGSHGKQFIATAAFLAHVDDEPHFGNQVVFSMPLTAADMIAQLKAELEAEKKKNEGKG